MQAIANGENLMSRARGWPSSKSLTSGGSLQPAALKQAEEGLKREEALCRLLDALEGCGR